MKSIITRRQKYVNYMKNHDANADVKVKKKIELFYIAEKK